MENQGPKFCPLCFMPPIRSAYFCLVLAWPAAYLWSTIPVSVNVLFHARIDRTCILDGVRCSKIPLEFWIWLPLKLTHWFSSCGVAITTNGCNWAVFESKTLFLVEVKLYALLSYAYKREILYLISFWFCGLSNL